jgi:hypothetical protein
MDHHKRINIIEVVTSDQTEGEKHLRSFISAANSDEPPPPETMKFLIHSFDRILRGKDPKMALKLTKRKGDKEHAHTEKYLTWAVMVEEKRMKGMGKDEARKAVASDVKKSFKTIRRRHKEHGAGAKQIIKIFQKFDELKKQRKE